MNQPYVKQYKNGIIQNPIEGKLSTMFLNRQQRRKELRGKRPFNNKKTCSPFRVQFVRALDTGEMKIIRHAD